VDHPDEHRVWARGERTVVALSVPDELALRSLLVRCARAGVLCSCFHEPDLGDALTACAFSEDAAPLLGSLPLALRQKRAA